MSTRRSCSVPECLVNTTRNPEKYFFSSPSDKKRRKLWLKRMRRDKKSISPNTIFYVCEDHFDLENDLENYIKFKYAKGKKKNLLKKEVLPHIFECQKRQSESTKSNVSSQKPKVRSAALKINHRRLINECIAASSNTSIGEENLKEAHPLEEQTTHDPPIFGTSKIVQSESRKKLTSHSVKCTSSEDNFCSVPKCEVVIVESQEFSDEAEPLMECIPAASGPSEYSQSSTDCESKTVLLEFEKKSEEMKNLEAYVQHINFLCRNKSELYLGIDPAAFQIIDNLCESLQCEEMDVFIVLLKIRRNYSFEELGDMFGTHQSHIIEKFNSMLPKICDYMKNFLKWPSTDKIEVILPDAFHVNDENLQVIVDCFEIQIEKPSDPKLQASTWSENKRANIVKYLIAASAPSGTVIYISESYGGRMSDFEIVKESGFLDVLPKKCSVMVDRGFEGIDSLLYPLRCTLIRPPSVADGQKLTNDEEALTKEVASLRIGIDQVMDRLYEFLILKPYASVNHWLLKYLDRSVIIACSIINLQFELIKS